MMSEKELLQKLKLGEQDAFRELVEQYSRMVINTCYGFLRSQKDGEDIAQEVFIEVFISIQKFRGDSKLSTWIYRIAVTKSLDQLKMRKRKKRATQLKSLFGMDNNEMEILANNESNPESIAEKQERKIVLQTAISSLAENQKIAITLNKIEGFSYKEISEIMDISISSVESLIVRAKKNLKNKLTSYYKRNL
ncbi:MAG: sigma-70 family RNA polymerase sigma factor [Ignavibacteria bacterium]